MGMCYGTARSRVKKLRLESSNELSRESEQVLPLTSSPGGSSKPNSEDNCLDQPLTKKVISPVNVVKAKASTDKPCFDDSENIKKIWKIYSTGNELGKSSSSTSADRESGCHDRAYKKKRLVPKVEDPILISSFGELTDDKPLRFFAHDDYSCSLSIRATSFEMLWDHGDSVIPTSQYFYWKSSQQRSPKFYITGSVTRKPKAFILNPAKLIVSICGVEIGLRREFGGLLSSDYSAHHSQLRESDSLPQPQSLALVVPTFGDTCSNASNKTITPSWFACEGFFLHSTSKDEKTFLRKKFPEDIANILWQYLPESKFKDRAMSVKFGEEHQLKGLEIFKSFKVEASSIKEVVVSQMDLEAVAQSNWDAACSSIVFNDLNGLYVSPHKSPLLPRKKIQNLWETEILLPTIDRKQMLLSDKDSNPGDMKKIESPLMEATPKPWSFNRITKKSSRGFHYLTVTGEKKDSRKRERLSRATSSSSNYLTVNRDMDDQATYKDAHWSELKIPQDLLMGIGKTSSSFKSVSSINILPEEELSNPYGDPIRPQEQANSSGGQTISSGGRTSSEPEVIITTFTKAPDWVPSNYTLTTNLTPEKLLELIDDFETRVWDAILEAISSEDNQCRWAAKRGSEQKYLSEIAKEVDQKRTKRAERKAEDQLRRMAILLRPENQFNLNVTNELDHVAEDQEYPADTDYENRLSHIKKTKLSWLSTTNEFRGLCNSGSLPYTETNISEEPDHHLSEVRKQTQ